MYTAIGVQCPHCGTTGMIQHDTRYEYTRCVACGREWNWQTGQTIYPVVGSEAEAKRLDKGRLASERARIRAMFPNQDSNLPPGTRRCERCGRTFEICNESPMCSRCERILRSRAPQEPRYITHNYFHGRKVGATMKNKGLTRARVAFALGLSQSTVSGYIVGNSTPEPDVARKICEMLELDFETHYRQITMLRKGRDWSRRPKFNWDDLHHSDEQPAESQEMAVG